MVYLIDGSVWLMEMALYELTPCMYDICALMCCRNLPLLVPMGQTSSEYANLPASVRGNVNPTSTSFLQKFSMMRSFITD